MHDGLLHVFGYFIKFPRHRWVLAKLSPQRHHGRLQRVNRAGAFDRGRHIRIGGLVVGGNGVRPGAFRERHAGSLRIADRARDRGRTRSPGASVRRQQARTAREGRQRCGNGCRVAHGGRSWSFQRNDTDLREHRTSALGGDQARVHRGGMAATSVGILDIAIPLLSLSRCSSD